MQLFGVLSLENSGPIDLLDQLIGGNKIFVALTIGIFCWYSRGMQVLPRRVIVSAVVGEDKDRVRCPKQSVSWHQPLLCQGVSVSSPGTSNQQLRIL